MFCSSTTPTITETYNKLSADNKEKLGDYAKKLLIIQEKAEKKQRYSFNHRLDHYSELWEYMTKEIIETHKKSAENLMEPNTDIIYRSRYSEVNIFGFSRYIDIFGKNHHKVHMADYLMFNPYFNLDYNMVDRLLPYCKIRIIDDYTYKVDGWIYEQLCYGGYKEANYRIRYDNSDYDDMNLVTTEEDKKMTIRLLNIVMNEIPEEYVNFNNYNIIAQWSYDNDNYLCSYQMNLCKLEMYKQNKENDAMELATAELIIQLDDKLELKEIRDILEQNVKNGTNDVKEMGIQSIKTKSIDEIVNINTKQLDLSEYYKENGYIKTKTVIDCFERPIKTRINCNNYLKQNGEKMTKEELFAGLYNSSSPCGMGFLQSKDDALTIEKAAEILNRTNYIDYFDGIAFKMSFRNFPIIDFERFDKRNGKGKFMECIQKIQGCDESITQKEPLSGLHVAKELLRMMMPPMQERRICPEDNSKSEDEWSDLRRR